MSTYKGRGVYFLTPTARLALDDAHTEVDVNGPRLLVRNRHRYPQKTLAGDFMVRGRGTTKDGRDTAISFHTRFDKRGDRFFAYTHLHPSENTRLIAVECEPFEVVLDNGKSQKIVMDAASIAHAWRHPPLADRLGRALIRVDDRSSRDRVELDVCIGLGPLRTPVARLQVLKNELRITLLRHSSSAEQHIARAFFLLGLEAKKLSRGESFSFSLTPETEHIARAYLEFDFVGAILAAKLSGRAGSASITV